MVRHLRSFQILCKWSMLVMNMVVKQKNKKNKKKEKIFEKRVLEISKRVRFVLLTLAFDTK